MACCQPFSIINPNYNVSHAYKWFNRFLEVPCGWCLNCRVDRQNWLCDACYYEQKKYNYSCAFVTFTYDDIHILDRSNFGSQSFYHYVDEFGKIQVAPYYSDIPVQYSLCRDDARAFLKRLRSKINYYYEKHNLENVDLCRKDFKVLYNGEYGDSFGRPHYHFLFFGLDWNFCKELFADCWQFGIVYVKPVQAGAFEYVTKYLTKQCHGIQAERLYDDNKIERPFISHSIGFGKGLILDQYDFILSHNICYKTINDTLRPVPIYYRNHFIHKRPIVDFSNTSNNMLQVNIKPDIPFGSHIKYRYSLQKMNQYRHEQALLRERQLEKYCEDNRIPYEPILSDTLESFNSDSLISKIKFSKVKRRKHKDNIPRFSDGSINWELYLYGDVVPF